MLTIQPQYLSLSTLLAGRLFQIPGYQRAYSWTSQQREDLFKDIRKTHAGGPESGHFMAAVVCLRRRKQTIGTDAFHVLDVVDGQQRLTTLIILLASIKQHLNRKNRHEEKLADELDQLLVKADGGDLLLLQTNHDSTNLFANFLRKGLTPSSKSAKTIADRELLEAMQECRKFVTDWRSQSSLLGLATLLKNQLYFLLHEIDDEKTVYTVFEVLNSRGLVVSWLDRLKSILMGTAFELKKSNQAGVIKELHNSWRDIYKTIGLRQGMSTEALRFAATLRAPDSPNRPLGEEDAVDSLRSMATTASELREVAGWLLQVTEACDRVVANPRMNAVTRISQARLLAVALHLRPDLKDKDRDRLLSRWEKVSFRIYGLMGHDARTRVGDYVRLAWQIINENLKPEAIDRSLLQIGEDFPIKKAIEELRITNCYEGWENELRYLMYRYEEHLAKSQQLNFSNEQWERIWMVSPSESIEHILPSSKAHRKHRHRLGNLVLLPPKLNSKLQDDEPTDKADSYLKTGLLIAIEAAEVITSEGWQRDQIQKREERILKWAAKEWAD